MLFLSTPVGPLGSGLGGGVELILHNVAQEMMRRGHKIKILAPEGSVLGNASIVQIPGQLQTNAQSQKRKESISMPRDSVLVNMWNYAQKVENEYDLIFNMAYDWLPFYLTPCFNRAIAHLVSMGSLTDAMDRIIGNVAVDFPGTIGVFTKSQAATFPFSKRCRRVIIGFDLSLYNFCPQPNSYLGWVGRIAPEKGLEDAVAAAEITGIPLKIMGKIQDEAYWQKILRTYPNAPIKYVGFLSTDKLQKELGECKAFLMTPHWVEAFGNVVIESLACGVPVIAYQRGGPSEVVKHGKTGFLVEPDSVDGLVTAIGQIDKINRYDCRQQVERKYTLEAMGDNIENWFLDVLRSHAIQRHRKSAIMKKAS